MDYEKKYKDALSRARSMYESQDDAELAAYIFPELAESEDERIRKEIRNFLIDMECKKEWITHLEKQKKSTWTEEDESFRKHILPRILNPTSWTLEQREADRKLLKEFVERQKNKWVEKQKEQKPAEWSEEDEKMRNLIVAIFEVNHPDGFFKANELGTTDMRGVHTKEIISWLKSLRPSWKPSEEQMEALQSAINACESEWAFGQGGFTKEMVVDYKTAGHGSVEPGIEILFFKGEFKAGDKVIVQIRRTGRF